MGSKSGNGAGGGAAAAGGRPAARSGAVPRSRSEGGAGVTGSVLRGAGGEKENRGMLLLQPEVQRWHCLRWICLLGKRGKVPFLTWTQFTEPCSTRSLPLEKSKRSLSRCRKSLRTNRSGGRGGVKSTMID